MKSFLSVIVFSLVLAVGMQSNAYGAPFQTAEGVRTERPLGIYGSLLGEPFGLVGINFARNTTDFLRVNLGIGYTSSSLISSGAMSFGTGVKLLVPGWDFTPVIGTNLSLLALFSGPAGFVQYENIGVEYTSPQGFHMGVGINTLFIVEGSTSLAGGVVPYLNVGMFF